ncbi:unnamed protein product [Brugia pahangi]|uniref:Uncharacterized protein n=1 Tax=Brugia pahangi TaxID=6280 RepID=A0A0N4TI75_BRUPA|nr:unnamed protein product [Brugia pahangi]
MEENDNLRSRNPKSSSASISKYNDESTEAVNQKEIYRTQFVGKLNEINGENGKMSEVGTNSTPQV